MTLILRNLSPLVGGVRVQFLGLSTSGSQNVGSCASCADEPRRAIGKKTPSGDVNGNSIDFCEYLLERALVAAVAGSAFGLEGYFRISYATFERRAERSQEAHRQGVR